MCPNCNFEMIPLELQDNVGQIFKVNQCKSCKSFWLPVNTIYKIATADAQKIDQQGALLQKTSSIKCPECQVELKTISDSTMPQDLQLLRCPKCYGYFLFPGQLSYYKNFQEQRTQDYQRLQKQRAAVGQTATDQQIKRNALIMSIIFLFTASIFWLIKETSVFKVNAETITPIKQINKFLFSYIQPIIASSLFFASGILVYLFGRKKWTKLFSWILIIFAFLTLILWLLV